MTNAGTGNTGMHNVLALAAVVYTAAYRRRQTSASRAWILDCLFALLRLVQLIPD
jgi:hypothetical protein